MRNLSQDASNCLSNSRLYVRHRRRGCFNCCCIVDNPQQHAYQFHCRYCTRGRETKSSKIDRLTIAKSSTEERWNSFLARWEMFKRGTRLMPGETVQHLFQCCEEELCNDILQSHPDSTRGDENNLLSPIKRLAKIPVAVNVRRSDLLSIS